MGAVTIMTVVDGIRPPLTRTRHRGDTACATDGGSPGVEDEDQDEPAGHDQCGDHGRDTDSHENGRRVDA